MERLEYVFCVAGVCDYVEVVVPRGDGSVSVHADEGPAVQRVRQVARGGEGVERAQQQHVDGLLQGAQAQVARLLLEQPGKT